MHTGHLGGKIMFEWLHFDSPLYLSGYMKTLQLQQSNCPAALALH